jgi:HD-GYP domain-containing protein (c-di-GMP phosphodiesterase class II)
VGKILIRADLSKYIGFRVNKNIYNRFSVLVLPANAVLTGKDIHSLIQQEIMLKEDDVVSTSILHLVDLAVDEIKDTFEKTRDSGKIPFEKLHGKIIPIIVEMSELPDISPILTRMEERDTDTYRHSIGVAVLSRLIGKLRRMSEPELLELTVAGFLHDIGKVKIPERIVQKTGKLSPEEIAQIRRHPEYGYEIMSHSPGITERQALVALQHHEREDGSGYPFGLTGAEIDPHSKIVAVADVFHAMISRRPYKDPVPFHKVIQAMLEDVYGALEPGIALPFIQRMMEMTIGNDVLLSNGYRGKVVMISSNDPVHPIVEVQGQFIDLSKERSIRLEDIV